MKIGLVSVAGVVLLAGVGCGGDEEVHAVHGVFEGIGDRHYAAPRGGGLYDSPVAAMPQRRYAIDGKDPVSVADAYVAGDLISVEPGRSFRWTRGASREVRHQLTYNAPDAQVSTIHLTFRVARSIVAPNQDDAVRGEFEPGQNVTVAIALNAPVDIESAQKELLTSQQYVALLYRPSPVFDYDTKLWAVLEDGAFLGKVDANNVVTFPGYRSEVELPPTTVGDLERKDDTITKVRTDPDTGTYRKE